jgi:GNAT superfamily N-acetyltransferase
MLSQYTVMPFDIYKASDEEYERFHAFATTMRLERQPTDPPLSLTELMETYRNLPPALDWFSLIVVTAEGEIIGHTEASTSPTEENLHLMEASIEVLPEFRRQGIGKALLRRLVNEAQQRSKSLLLGATASKVPAGEAFAERIGATRGLESVVYQLSVDNVDRALLRRWLEQAATDEFELVWLDGPYPEEILAPITDLFNIVMNDAPRDDLEVEDEQKTPELVRQFEKMTLSAGNQRWTAYLRTRENGDFAGLTELMWHPSRPHLARQGWTGIHPSFRRRGLGRWLKAAMLEKLINERSEVQYVRTGNANSNAPMLRINEELGFHSYLAWSVWQVKLDSVLRYLNESA